MRQRKAVLRRTRIVRGYKRARAVSLNAAKTYKRLE
jgi:hypothetical protein